MTKHYTLEQLAKLFQVEAKGNFEHVVTGIEGLENATSSDVSFLASPKYHGQMLKSKAGIICVTSSTELQDKTNYLISANPSELFQKILELFVPDTQCSSFEGMHPTAIIHPTAVIDPSVRIGPYAVIDAEVHIGAHTEILAHTTLCRGVKIGKNCLIYPQVTIRERCVLGNRVIIQPGAVVGSCGFGYLTNEKGLHSKLQQLGKVILEDDVEIGANTTIDRARFKSTIIARGTKIDNLVQIAHNVEIGQDNIIISQTGIAGSTKTGRHVIFGGQAGIVGHIEITDNVMIGAKGGVSKSIEKSGKYAGSPVLPLAEHNKMQVHLRKISQYVEKLEKLQAKLEEAEVAQN